MVNVIHDRSEMCKESRNVKRTDTLVLTGSSRYYDLLYCSWKACWADGESSISLSSPTTWAASSLSSARFNMSQLRDLIRSRLLQDPRRCRHSLASAAWGDVANSCTIKLLAMVKFVRESIEVLATEREDLLELPTRWPESF